MSVSWSDCVVHGECDAGGGSLGLRFRAAVHGPEQVLVEAFLDAAKMELPSQRCLTVFAQPALETGFPDLVAVVWRTAVARMWVPEREKLRSIDLRLLHLLATHGPVDLVFLQGLFRRGLNGMLNRLEEAGVVAIGKSACRARSWSRIFAVERIVAVEAKANPTQRALEQAGTNAWFSSESHALFPQARIANRMLDLASSLGVGVLRVEQDAVSQVGEAITRAVPRSYGSWLFNEWTWRIARAEGWF